MAAAIRSFQKPGPDWTGLDWIYSMAFSSDEKKLAGADRLGVVQIWKVDSEGLHLTHALREGRVLRYE